MLYENLHRGSPPLCNKTSPSTQNPILAQISVLNRSIMHPSISRSYIVPAIFLNPVLFLMSVNTILSRLLPPIIVDAVKQPPPYSTFGPSAEHPHLDIHASESLCWGYTFVMVCAQIVAFGRVSDCREAGKARARTKKERSRVEHRYDDNETSEQQGSRIVLTKRPFKHDCSMSGGEGYSSCAESDLDSRKMDGSDESGGTTDSETIL